MKRIRKVKTGKMSQMVVFLLVLMALGLTPAIVTAVPVDPVQFNKWNFDIVLTIEVTPFDEGYIQGWKHLYTFGDMTTGGLGTGDYEILRVDIAWGSSEEYPVFEAIAPLGYGFGDEFTEIEASLVSSAGTSIFDDGSAEYKTMIEPASPVGVGGSIESFYIVYPELDPDLLLWQTIRMKAKNNNDFWPIPYYDSQQAFYSEDDYPIPPAVPEPGTILLLGSGITALGIFIRRRRKAVRKVV